jgi:hypothetical protein
VTCAVPSSTAGSREAAAPGRTYAVAWQRPGEGAVSGGLRADREGLHLLGRAGTLHLLFAQIARLSIERGRTQRLRGLPAIVLQLASGGTLRIASLEGTGALHEIAELAQRAGVRSG